MNLAKLVSGASAPPSIAASVYAGLLILRFHLLANRFGSA